MAPKKDVNKDAEGIKNLVEGIAEVAVYVLKAIYLLLDAKKKGKKEVVRTRTRYRMKKLASKIKRAKPSDVIKYTNIANREELALKLGMEIKREMKVKDFQRRISRISERKLLMAEDKLPGALLYLFAQKIIKSETETSFRPMELGSSLKKGDSFRLMLSWNWYAKQNIGLKKILQGQKQVYKIKLHQLGRRGKSGIAKRAANGSFYFIKADGSKGKYAEVFDSLVTVLETKAPTMQQKESQKKHKAEVAKVGKPKVRRPKVQVTPKVRPITRHKERSLGARRIKHPAYSPGEGVDKLVYKSYFATLEEQREFDDVVAQIKHINDPIKLASLAKRARENASDREPIVRYMGKYARHSSMLVFALFKRDLELLSKETGKKYTVVIQSALRRLKWQGDKRKANEVYFTKKITEKYKRRLKKLHPHWSDEKMKKVLNDPAMKASIKAEMLAIVANVIAKKTKSKHLSGAALDIRVLEDGESLLSHNFMVDTKKGQTVWMYKTAWKYYNLVEDGPAAMNQYKAKLRTKYKAKYPNESEAKIEARIAKQLRKDKYCYDKIRLYKYKNKHGQWVRIHWKMMVARRRAYKATRIQKFYPASTELWSELWHKNVGANVYKKPELAKKLRPGTIVKVAAKKRPAVRAPMRIPTPPEIKEKAPESWPPSLVTKHIDIPSTRLYATLIRPKQKPKPGQRVVIMPFFSGKYISNQYTKFRAKRGKLKPPPHIAELIAKKYMLEKSKRRMLAWHMEKAKQGIYPVVIFCSEVHSGKKNPGSNWYHDFRRRYVRGRGMEDSATVSNRISNIFAAIRDKTAQEVGKEPERGYFISGHSMGGLPIMSITEKILKGEIDMKVDGLFNSDSTYFSVWKTCAFVKRTGVPWFISFRENTRTRHKAKIIIRYFELKMRKRPDGRGWIYLNPKYPNVIVTEIKKWRVSHGAHAGAFFPEAWENSNYGGETVGKQETKKPKESKEIVTRGRFKENDFDAERARRIARGEEDVEKYEGPLDTQIVKCPYTGNNIHITRIGPNNGKLDKKSPVNVITYFQGHGNPKKKRKWLFSGKHRKNFALGLRKIAKEHKKNFVIISIDGESNQPSYTWLWNKNWPNLRKKPDYDAGRYLEIMRLSEKTAGITGRKINRYMMGHSGAYRAMEGLGYALNSNYFLGRGDLDTKYGTKRHKRAEITHRLLDKHNKMKYYSIYVKTNNSNDPYYNDQRLRALLNKDPLGRDAKSVSFNLSRKENHTSTKSAGAIAAVKWWLKV